MFKQLSWQRFAALLISALLITSGAGMVAAETWDTETTNDSSTSDISGASNSATWYTDNSSKELYVEVDGQSTENYTLHISNADTGISETYYSNSTPTTDGAGNASWSLTHTELDGNLPSDYQGGTYNVTVTNDTDTEVLSTELTLTKDSGSADANIYVSNASDTPDAIGHTYLADSLDVESKDVGLFSLSTVTSLWSDNDSEPQTTTFRDDTAVNGSNTTVVYHLENTSTADAFGSAAEDAEDGDWLRSQQVHVSSSVTNSQILQVYHNEAPEEVENGTTYAVYDSSAETLTVHLGDDYKTAQDISVTAVGNEKYGFFEAAQAFGYGETVSNSVGL